MPTIKYQNKKGERLPGSTTVISMLGLNKTPLMIWANREGLAGREYPACLQKATDTGTLIHYLIEEYLLKCIQIESEN